MIININDFSNGSIDNTNPQDPKWAGTGVFDVLMKAVNDNIKIQNQMSRITGAEYAEVYLGALETCIREAANLLLQRALMDKEIELKQAQILKIQADTLNTQEEIKIKGEELKLKKEELKLKAEQLKVAAADARLKDAQADAYPTQALKDALLKQVQVDLYERQIEGFDDNKRQKLFDACVNGWALAYSSGILDKAIIPSFINNTEMASLFATIKG